MLGGLASCLIAGGCTSESTRVALESQRRADQVTQALFERQHDALRVLLYRDLTTRLAAVGELSAAQREIVNEAWNERDLIEFWATQFERAKALRLVGVDAKLYAGQSIVDLLWKALSAKVDRAQQGLAAAAGARLETIEPADAPPEAIQSAGDPAPDASRRDGDE